MLAVVRVAFVRQGEQGDHEQSDTGDLIDEHRDEGGGRTGHRVQNVDCLQ